MSSGTSNSVEEPRFPSLQSVKSELPEEILNVFVSHADSYHGREIVRVLKEVQESSIEVQPSEVSKTESVEESPKGTLETITEENLEEPSTLTQKGPKKVFRVTATLEGTGSSSVDQVLDSPVPPECLLDQDFLVFDLNFSFSTVNEALQAVKFFETWAQTVKVPVAKKFLIFITNPMTWGKTNFEGKIHEKQYRSRRSHPCYRRYVRLEQEATNLQTKFPNIFRTLILCPGVTFGFEEDILHYFFKTALLNQQDVKVAEPGTNIVPLLHVSDLAKIVKKIILELPEMSEDERYIFAVNPELQFQAFIYEICRRIGGPDVRLKISPFEELLLVGEDLMPQRVLDKISLNLNVNMEDGFLKDFPFSASPEQAVADYYEARKIQPLKVLVHGPPNSGKTTLSMALACYYSLCYLDADQIVGETETRLLNRVTEAENFMTASEKYEAYKADEMFKRMLEQTRENVEKWREQIDLLKNLGGLSKDEQTSEKERLLLERLKSPVCARNVGFIIDGFSGDANFLKKIFFEGPLEPAEDSKPSLTSSGSKQASSSGEVSRKKSASSSRKRSTKKISFERSGASSASGDSNVSFSVRASRVSRKGEESFSYEVNLKPDFFIYLRFDSSVMNKVEGCVCSKYYGDHCEIFSSSDSDSDEDILDQAVRFAVKKAEQKRLENFVENEYEDKSVYTLFLDHKFPALEFNVNKCPAKSIYKRVREKLGSRNPYLVSEEKREFERRMEEDQIRREEEKKAEKLRKKLEDEKAEKRKRMEVELDKKMLLKQQELWEIEACSVPLKEYLKRNIIPKLTEGLVEVAKLRPAQPIEYLAEFLFQNNPDGRMFDPCVSEAEMEDVLQLREEEIASDCLSFSEMCSQNLSFDPEM